MGAADFLSLYLSGPLPYVRRHITVNKMCYIIKHFLLLLVDINVITTGYQRVCYFVSRMADSPLSLSASRLRIDDGAKTRNDETWTAVSDSLFVGETDNVGKVVEPYQRSLLPGGP